MERNRHRRDARPAGPSSTTSRFNGTDERNLRMRRFEQYLENRGCPVKLSPKQGETDIRWIG